MYQAAQNHVLSETRRDTAPSRILDSNIGFHQFMGGRYTEALAILYQSAIPSGGTCDLPQEVAQCDRETADVYLELNLVPEARETFERDHPNIPAVEYDRGSVARSEMGLSLALLHRKIRHAEALASSGARRKGISDRKGTGSGWPVPACNGRSGGVGRT